MASTEQNVLKSVLLTLWPLKSHFKCPFFLQFSKVAAACVNPKGLPCNTVFSSPNVNYSSKKKSLHSISKPKLLGSCCKVYCFLFLRRFLIIFEQVVVKVWLVGGPWAEARSQWGCKSENGNMRAHQLIRSKFQ